VVVEVPLGLGEAAVMEAALRYLVMAVVQAATVEALAALASGILPPGLVMRT
jgi:hypothetical protein